MTDDHYGQKEHPHHNSLWVGMGEVNGVNHWALEGEKTPQQRHIKFEKVEGDTIIEDLNWDGPDAPRPMLHDAGRSDLQHFPPDCADRFHRGIYARLGARDVSGYEGGGTGRRADGQIDLR